MAKRKFSDEEIDRILERFKANDTLRGIALDFNCHHKTIANIINNNGYATAERKIPFHHKRERTMQSGYIRWYDPTSPYCNAHGDVYEHRHVMSEHLGRALLPGETVHHRNGNRTDNRIENLELWVSFQPSGQRPEDLLEWADEIIRRYRCQTI